ncbi:MAG: methylglyoxal synthase [Lachnospiraceae bacterium]|nr:methylglyoxal synthase [Lachnospiraceae bacterium]
MNIGLTAHNSKKSLMEDFCIAYRGILSKHDLYATGTTGKRVEEVTGLKVAKLLPGSVGGDMQFMEMVERNGLDLVIFFYNPNMTFMKEMDVYRIVRICDQYSIPVATNVATAEMLILGMERGDLDWRLQISGRDE